ncbi:MucBP domain-containing protein [Lactococcus lactis]|uniref:MucBP domain-containing protein n=1 Tax=Lactococcus lactis TaxID=1358 RepID=A0A9X4NKL3_9LACT|nr:MucBP domain-containing protein [Lactococcus lactis]MDG4984969.1 MucBP domain-containing protein [Lactococcus lactis]
MKKHTYLVFYAFIIIFSLLTIFLIPPKFLADSLLIDTDIPINSINFPDNAFRAYIQKFDTNQDGYLSVDELNSIDTIKLSDSDIKDITGIKLFKNLKMLDIQHTKITNLDLQNMKKLTNVEYTNNSSLTTLDFRHCDNLVTAHHSENNETVYISAGMLRFVGCPYVPEHTGHLIIDLRGLTSIDDNGNKTCDLTKVISPTLIKVFKEQGHPGFDPSSNTLSIPRNETSSDYSAGIDGNNKATSWTFITDGIPAPVTVHYVDGEGKTIHFDENLTGYYGQKVSANIMDINGYRFKKVKNDASKDATISYNKQEITLIYEKLGESVNKSDTCLPQTGTQSTVLMDLFGLLLICASASIFISQKHY